MRAYDLPVRLERAVLDLFRLPEVKKEERRRKRSRLRLRRLLPTPDSPPTCRSTMIISERFQRAAADATADRFKPGESEYVRDVLSAAAERDEE